MAPIYPHSEKNPRRKKIMPPPIDSGAFKDMYQAYEDKIQTEEAAACSISPHEREILDRSFASVKFEFTDLDGLTWSQAAKRQNSDTYLSHNPDPLTGWVVPSCRSHDAIRIRSCSNLYKPHLIGSADQIDPKDRGSRLAGIELASGAALDSETSTSRQQAQPEMSKTPPSYSPRQKLKRTEASRCFTSSDTDTPAPLRPETYCPDPLLSSIPRVAANENSRLKLSGDHGPVPPVSTGDGISSA